MKELNIDGMSISPSVVETIVSIATSEVAGVASVGAAGPSGLLGKLSKQPASQGIEVSVNEDNTLHIAVRVDVKGGYVIPELAASIRQAVADAVLTQAGLRVGDVDVYIDGIQF
ncbi:MAG: Asp23/Gls24 family envelope stress response protein [Coriobacteriia bacterium]|nr:Asp23/Gls24 family envelope stress response protein [Coriobacteriia bacterium]